VEDDTHIYTHRAFTITLNLLMKIDDDHRYSNTRSRSLLDQDTSGHQQRFCSRHTKVRTSDFAMCCAFALLPQLNMALHARGNMPRRTLVGKQRGEGESLVPPNTRGSVSLSLLGKHNSACQPRNGVGLQQLDVLRGVGGLVVGLYRHCLHIIGCISNVETRGQNGLQNVAGNITRAGRKLGASLHMRKHRSLSQEGQGEPWCILTHATAPLYHSLMTWRAISASPHLGVVLQGAGGGNILLLRLVGVTTSEGLMNSAHRVSGSRLIEKRGFKMRFMTWD
jgi:hypothetical protein